MATNLGDLSVTLQLDIRPYAEGIKTALNIGKQFEAQSKNLGKGINVDTSKIDAEMKKLEDTLKGFADKSKSAEGSSKSFGDSLDKTNPVIKKSTASLLEMGSQLVIVGAGFRALANDGIGRVKDFIGEANKLQSATLGLQSLAKFKGIDPLAATETLKNLDLVKNGLLSVGEASLALRNLLASGFTLGESIDLIKAFGDSAAFGKQSALSFGYAITSATEGIKNQNSILVDNAGVTKNLSIILKEAGFSEKDLMNVTTDLGVRTALYNGILKETAAFTGDAEKLSKTFAGQQEKLDKQVVVLKQSFGIFLQEALLPYITKITEGSDTTKTFAGSLITLGGFVAQLAPTLYFAAKGFEAMGLGITAAGVAAAAKYGAFIALAYAIGTAMKELGDYTNEKFNLASFDEAGLNRKGIYRIEEDAPKQPKVGMGDVKMADKDLHEQQQNQTNQQIKSQEKLNDTKKSGAKHTKTEQVEELNRLKLLDTEIAKMKLVLASNVDELGAYRDIEKEILELTEQRRHLTGEDLKDLKIKVAEYENERQAIDEVIDNIGKKNELFEKIVQDSKDRIISSDEFQTAKIIFTDIADLMRNQLGQAWEDVFGKADTLAEMFLQSLAQKFLDMALQFALTSILSSLFPGAGLIASFFGGGSGASPGLSPGPGGLGNSIPDFLQRSPGIRSFERSISETQKVPYVASLEYDTNKFYVTMQKVGQRVTRRKG